MKKNSRQNWTSGQAEKTSTMALPTYMISDKLISWCLNFLTYKMGWLLYTVKAPCTVEIFNVIKKHLLTSLNSHLKSAELFFSSFSYFNRDKSKSSNIKRFTDGLSLQSGFRLIMTGCAQYFLMNNGEVL